MDHGLVFAVHALRRDPAEVGRARRLTGAFVRRHRPDIDETAVALAVSETVTNALQHGRGQIELRLELDEAAVIVTVSDDGTAATHPEIAGNRRVGGWGLRIVDRLTSAWGTTRQDERRIVWLRFLPEDSAQRAAVADSDDPRGAKPTNGRHPNAVASDSDACG